MKWLASGLTTGWILGARKLNNMEDSINKDNGTELQQFFSTLMKDALNDLTEAQRILLEAVAYKMWDAGYEAGKEDAMAWGAWID